MEKVKVLRSPMACEVGLLVPTMGGHVFAGSAQPSQGKDFSMGRMTQRVHALASRWGNFFFFREKDLLSVFAITIHHLPTGKAACMGCEPFALSPLDF